MVGSVADVPIIASTLLALAVGIAAWRRRPRPGAAMLAGFMATVVVWQGFHFLDHLVAGPVADVFDRLRWLGIASAAVWWLLFVLEYTGRSRLVTRRTLALAFAWPVAFNVALWLPALTGAVGVDAVDGLWAGVAAEESPLFWAHVLFSYALLATGTILLLQYSYLANALFRKQGLAIQLSLGVVWVGSVVSVFELFGSLHLHALPISFLLAGIPLFWATVRADLSAVTPIARATVFETIDAAVVVLDDSRTVIDLNAVAEALLGVDRRAVVGRPATVLSVLSELSLTDDRLADGGIGSVTHQIGDSVVRFDTSPVITRGGDRLGSVLVGYDVTEQHHHQMELQRKNERLDAFAGIVSHDLRSPLAVAAGKLELAAEVCETPHHDDVRRALERMDALIDDVLTLARKGAVVGETAPTDLGTLVENTWAQLDSGRAALAIADALPTIDCDADRVAALLENLFRNSIVHAGEAVTVTVGALDGGFYVADDGPGIPEAVRETVFESGYTTHEEGTGFGLAIVQGIAVAHGWTVGVAEGPGGGARFEITGVRPTSMEVQ